jgi:ornithine--oxo-acid transaminase
MMPPPGFLPEAKALLHKHGALLICDEVQVGLGRTGRFFSYQYDDVQPDIVTVAKALSGGYVPVGAMLTTDKIFSSVYSSMDKLMVHSTTFKGGPLAMAAGLAALAVIDDEGLVENAERRGAELMRGLEGLAAKYDLIGRPRQGPDHRHRVRQAVRPQGQGRLGDAAEGPGGPVRADGRRRAVPAAPDLTQVSGDHMEVIKLIPPLMIGDAEVKLFLDGLADVLDDASKGSGLMWDFGRTLIKQAVRA